MGKKPKPEPNQNQIHFFCDKCGYEVGQDTKSCPGCGRSFSSVKCPSCGFVGEATLFTEGCPVCGFFSQPFSSSTKKTQEITQTVQTAQTVQKIQNELSSARKPKKFHYYDLPVWIYIITFLALGVSIAALYFNIMR